jgi:hypothetical protein
VKKLLLHKILIIILLLGSIQIAFAQKSTKIKDINNKWFVGINGGVNMFWGDIKFNPFWPSPKMQELQIGGGLVFGRSLSQSFKISSELYFTSLRGLQEVYPDTLGFKTQALSFALKGHFNIISLFTKKDTKFDLFIESGAGIIAWRSLLQNHLTNDTLNDLGWSNSDYEFSYYIPAGIKFEYQISPKLSTHFTSSYNFVFSDLLDGEAIGSYDNFSYNSLGINYHFGKQKTIPKLLPYSFFKITYDSLTSLTSKNENPPKKAKETKEVINPFSVTIDVPEQASHTGFDIGINITKLGIPASGFFRLLVPSGFLPQSTPNDDISFTKLGYRYDYDFILPLNQDKTSIPIHIKLSEIEKGIFPILVEGEIIDQNGNVFPIKFASYIEIISEEGWNKGLPIHDQTKPDSKYEIKDSTKTIKAEKNNQIIQKDISSVALPIESKDIEPQKQNESHIGIYRIQFMASQKPYTNLESFKAKHKITDEIFISQADGWYRYNLYAAEYRNEAIQLCLKVRNENDIPQAFITYYENGKRVLSPNAKKADQTSSTLKEASSKNTNISNNKLLYRIEIAIGFEKPIPLYLLQKKVGKEPISEFKHKLNYYYTIGEFENLEVARAFLVYVKTQFPLGNAKIGQYQNNQRIKVVL